jgi:hypothetical protein
VEQLDPELRPVDHADIHRVLGAQPVVTHSFRADLNVTQFRF